MSATIFTQQQFCCCVATWSSSVHRVSAILSVGQQAYLGVHSFRRLYPEKMRRFGVRPQVAEREMTEPCPSPEILPVGKSGSDVVRDFYAGINRRDLDCVHDLIAEDCIYEDLVFPQPFVGRQAILEFFKKFTDAVGADLQFIIDDISRDDSFAVGVTWHLEWRGKRFPFSKGCSFYRLTISNGKRQIIYGRDSVEPALKPSDGALVAIKAIVALLERFPQLADRF